MINQEKKIMEKKANEQNMNATDDQQLVASKARSISINFLMAFAMHCG